MMPLGSWVKHTHGNVGRTLLVFRGGDHRASQVEVYGV